MSSKKKLLKKRKQKQLKRALKTTAKGIETATTETTILTPLEVYQSNLNEIYGGSVIVRNRNLLNLNRTMRYFCTSCKSEFYGKGIGMIGQDHQRHQCYRPYGVVGEERGLHVLGKRFASVKGGQPFDESIFYEIIWNDFSPTEIASKLKVNPTIVKEYFQREGLIQPLSFYI
ncbi:adenylate kinase [Ureibacillus composti]|nr:adenylate kinase [Ureibacillus composti]